MEEQLPLDLWPEAPPVRPPLLRYAGEERRWCRASDHFGVERRIPDPPTEQDHPEQFGAN